MTVDEHIDEIHRLLTIHELSMKMALSVGAKPSTEIIAKAIKKLLLEARLDELENLSVGIDDMCAVEWKERLGELNHLTNTIVRSKE